MNLFVKDLAPEIQILIAAGSAVAAGCQPCLERLVALANSQEIPGNKMQAAVTIGQLIKDQPGNHMKALADRLVGSHLSAEASGAVCGCPPEEGSRAQCGG